MKKETFGFLRGKISWRKDGVCGVEVVYGGWEKVGRRESGRGKRHWINDMSKFTKLFKFVWF